MAIFMSTYQAEMLESFIDLLMHEGIYTYNQKQSKASGELQRRAKQLDRIHKKGAIFAVRQKSDFGNGRVKGYIITSKETLLEQADYISHFTPNVYRRFAYTDSTRTYVKGFEEQNLQQVNTFVVDIDTKKYSVNDILLACIDESVGQPTAILETNHGYQVYFVLSEPLFISPNKKFLSLKVAKRISANLKESLKAVGADMYCNDFGFFRTPNSRNIVWFQEQTYSVKELVTWSERTDSDKNRQLFVISGGQNTSTLLSSEWVQLLLNVKNIKGHKGQMGRNNVHFTLALTCLQDGRDEEFALDLLDQFNSNLTHPLSHKELKACVASAYSGRYHGPKKEYVEHLIELYVPNAGDLQLSFGKPVWYKHKKAREDRERSHLFEWEQDISKYIAANKSVAVPFIWCTQKELCEAVGIASSSLNKLIKQSKRLLKTTMGKGRNAKTGWTTVELYMQFIQHKKKERAVNNRELLDVMVQGYIDLLEPVAGYETLVKYAKKSVSAPPIYEQLTFGGVG